MARFLISTSNNKEKYPICIQCGEKVKILFQETMICFNCRSKENIIKDNQCETSEEV